MKKVLVPFLWLVLACLLVLAAAYFYEQRWGVHGPFPARHGHHH
ncbi:MAG: hypothetical protein N2689_16750 [Verrucomicrobiae bacterium]|nr:hypothetical protein [Verrucomicrobiae bacterium]